MGNSLTFLQQEHDDEMMEIGTCGGIASPKCAEEVGPDFLGTLTLSPPPPPPPSSILTLYPNPQGENDYARFVDKKEGTRLTEQLIKTIVFPIVHSELYKNTVLKSKKSILLYGRTGSRKLSTLLYVLSCIEYTTVVVGNNNVRFFAEELKRAFHRSSNKRIAIVFNKVRLNDPNGYVENTLIDVLRLVRDQAIDIRVFLCMDEIPRYSSIRPEIMELCDAEVFADTPTFSERKDYLSTRIERINHASLQIRDKSAAADHHDKLVLYPIVEKTEDMLLRLAHSSEGCSYEDLDHFLNTVVGSVIDKELQFWLLDEEKKKKKKDKRTKRTSPTRVSITPGDVLDHMCENAMNSKGEQVCMLTTNDVIGNDKAFKTYYKQARSHLDGVEERRKSRLAREQNLLEETQLLHSMKRKEVQKTQAPRKRSRPATRSSSKP